MRYLILYTICAYGLSWAVWVPMILRDQIVVPGSLPTHMPGLLAPAIAALIAAAWQGRAAVHDLAARVTAWRMPRRAWIAALAPFAVVLLGLIITGMGTEEYALRDAVAGLGRYSGVPDYGVVAVIVIVFVVNCLGEEIGWRGFALPRLQAQFGPMKGTLVLFVIWALWHLPLFFIVATFMGMSLVLVLFGWLLGLLAGTLVLANVTYLAGGAVLAPALWHLGYNLTSATDLGAVVPAAATTGVMIWASYLIWRVWTGKGAHLLAVPQRVTPD